METAIKNLVYASHYMKGHETNVNDDYIECNEAYGLLLKAKDIGYKQAIEDAVKWWSSVPDDTYYHNPCLGFVEKFKEAMLKNL